MRIHVLTAVTRPRNLPILATGLAVASMRVPDCEVVWHWRYDLRLEHVGGQQPKNDMLDNIADGWVWIFDDDTIVHPDLFARVNELTAGDPDVRGVIVAQEVHGAIRHAHPDLAQVGLIDAGQAVLRRDLIGDHRLALNYEGDGHLLTELLTGRQDVVYLDEILSYYNALEVT